MKMEAQVKMKKNRTITFILILLVIFSLQNLNRIPCIYAGQKEKTSETYPATPEGVVEAFCREDFGRDGDYWKILQKYTSWKDAPGWDITLLVVSYSIRKIREDHSLAQVHVEYKTIGEYYWDDIGPVFKETKKKEVLVFKLIKKDKLWKIESPQEPPHFDVRIVIKDLEKALKNDKNIERRAKIEQVLRNIKNSLKSF